MTSLIARRQLRSFSFSNFLSGVKRFSLLARKSVRGLNRTTAELVAQCPSAARSNLRFEFFDPSNQFDLFVYYLIHVNSS
jgi:hypothetical protein